MSPFSRCKWVQSSAHAGKLAHQTVAEALDIELALMASCAAASGPLCRQLFANWRVFTGLLESSPSHGENRGSSPLGSANDFSILAPTWSLDVASISNFSPMDSTLQTIVIQSKQPLSFFSRHPSAPLFPSRPADAKPSRGKTSPYRPRRRSAA